MADELRAAAERLLDPDGGIGEGTVTDYVVGGYGADDAILLARAYLAEHPAGDELPVTEEWLRSVGFYAGRFSEDLVLGPIVCDLTAAYWLVHTYRIPNGSRPRTQGAVRRLCRALGVPLVGATR